ncbi:MAG: hypothetical protein ACRENP_24315 [Longimicrobiales bacterium]
MVYWLEFKDDEEFPAVFGSIAGGNALKFGVYKRSETGTWVAGQMNSPREVTVAEAVEIAQQHRDQFLHAAEAIAKIPPEAGDESSPGAASRTRTRSAGRSEYCLGPQVLGSAISTHN